MLRHIYIGNWSEMVDVEVYCEMCEIEDLRLFKIVMFIGLPLGVKRRSRVRISEEEKCGSEISKEGLISLILGSDDGVHGW